MNFAAPLATFIILISALLPGDPPPTGTPAFTRKVALTFDDIPLGQGQPGTRCNREELLRVNQSITAALVQIKAPSAAFITTGNLCDQIRNPVLGEVIQTWENAGAVIGNHGHRHLSLSRVPLAEYRADLARADSLLRLSSRVYRGPANPAPGTGLLRHPFLHVGPDTATANGLARWLEEQRYAVAPVTIDNNEWVYARAYSLALGRAD